MKRLGPSYLWFLSLAVPAAVFATSACSDPASSPGGNGGSNTGTGGAVPGSTGGSETGTGGAASTLGGNTSTGGIGTTATGGIGTTATGGTGTTATGGTGTTTGGSSTAGGTSATGGATVGGSTAGGATGTGGAGPKVKLCATKTALTVPLMTNFDTYDGKTAADAWSFPFNGKTGADADAPYAGPYTYNDMTGTPFIGMVGGANASTYAISISNPMATVWGGALAFWMGCANASTYSGVQFNARGTIPTGMVSVSLTLEQTSAPDAVDANGGGTCDAATLCKSPEAAVAVTADWTLIQIPWAMFTPGVGSGMAAVTPNGDNIAGFAFSVGLNYVESPAGSATYVATPAAYDLQIDDLGFY